MLVFVKRQFSILILDLVLPTRDKRNRLGWGEAGRKRKLPALCQDGWIVMCVYLRTCTPTSPHIYSGLMIKANKLTLRRGPETIASGTKDQVLMSHGSACCQG